METAETAAIPVPADARRHFARLGWSLNIMFLFAAVLLPLLAGVAGVLLTLLGPGLPDPEESPFFFWCLSYLPLYGIGLPLSILMLRRIPAQPVQPQSITAGRFLYFLLLCAPIAVFGDKIGSLAAALLSGGTAVNLLDTMVTQLTGWDLIAMLVMAPVMEELLFRKTILDRFTRYGEETALLISALLFSLFHMNIYQFPYTFGIGLLLGYLYLRTRRVSLCMLLHCLINFFGGGIWKFLLTGLSESSLAALKNGTLTDAMVMEALPEFLPMLVYNLVVFAAAAIGLMQLIRHRHDAVFLPAQEPIPRGKRFRTIFLSGGMIVFCLGALLASLLAL